jgi:amidophosphoribosyltransferase
MCGLIGVTGTVESAYEVYMGLMNLQHRGQDGAGILTTETRRGKEFHLQKGTGLVENVFSERSFKDLRGSAAIGHTRYATISRNDPNLLQPFLDYRLGIGLAHNGQIVNFYELRDKLLGSSSGQIKTLESDSDLVLKLLTAQLTEEPNASSLFAAVRRCMDELVGSYAIVGLVKDGSLFGFRDPNGVRPLFLGKKTNSDGDTSYALASETVALSFLGYGALEEIGPGEAIYITSAGTVTRQVLRKDSYSPCMFEWVYFARVESEFGQTSVYKARFKLGQILAEQMKKDGILADVVVPVPETSRISAVAIAETLELPFRELLIKNRYVQRTFILEGQESRLEAIRRKLFPIAEEIEGKRCLIVDDSIVRGNTANQIVKLVRQAGAREVILVSSCPPISNPCFYGIDFPSPDELIAYNRGNDEIARELGVDRVVFQTVDGLKAALGQTSLCTGCLTGEYPTDIGSAQEFEANRQKDREKPLGRRC